jgi:hypothetical protein
MNFHQLAIFTTVDALLVHLLSYGMPAGGFKFLNIVF